MTRRQPLVSIGLPVYNGERYLQECLDSLLAQTFEDFELIISDNASTDGTEEICRTYLDRDIRIRYSRNNENIGVYKNFNRVFQLSSGNYFKWASADDVCGKDLLARCLEALETHRSAVLAYPETTFIDETGKSLVLKDPGWNLLSESAQNRLRYVIYSAHWINAFYGLICAQSLAQTKLFAVYDSGDYRLLGELSLLGKFLEIPGRLFFRRFHPGASSQNWDQEWRSSFFFGTSRGVSLPYWCLCLDHSLTVIRSNFSPTQKISLLFSILSCMLGRRQQLLKELQSAFRHLVARRSV